MARDDQEASKDTVAHGDSTHQRGSGAEAAKNDASSEPFGSDDELVELLKEVRCELPEDLKEKLRRAALSLSEGTEE